MSKVKTVYGNAGRALELTKSHDFIMLEVALGLQISSAATTALAIKRMATAQQLHVSLPLEKQRQRAVQYMAKEIAKRAGRCEIEALRELLFAADQLHIDRESQRAVSES